MSAKVQPQYPRRATQHEQIHAQQLGGFAEFQAFLATEFKLRLRQPQLPLVLVLFALLTVAYLPEKTASYVTLTLGGQRGMYNPAWVGLVTSMFGALIFSLPAFWMVRGLTERDARRSTWNLLQSSDVPMKPLWLARWASNTLYLSLIWGVVVLTSLPMLLIRAEAPAIQWWNLFTPFLWLTLPTLALVSAVAVLSDSLNVLRRGMGSALWVGMWLLTVIGVMSNQPALDPTGVHTVLQQVWTQLSGQSDLKNADISLGFKLAEQPTPSFLWNGLHLTGAFMAGRLSWLLVAIGLTLVSTQAFQVPAVAAAPRQQRRWRPRWLSWLKLHLPALSSTEWRLAWQAVPLWWKLACPGLWAVGTFTDQTALTLVAGIPALTALMALSREANMDALLDTTGIGSRLRRQRLVLGLSCVLLPMSGAFLHVQSSEPRLVLFSSAVLLTGLAALLQRLNLRPMSTQLVLLALWYIGPFQHVPVLDVLHPSHWLIPFSLGLSFAALSLLNIRLSMSNVSSSRH